MDGSSLIVGSFTGSEPMDQIGTVETPHPWAETVFMGPRSSTGKRITPTSAYTHTPIWHALSIIGGDVGSLKVTHKRMRGENKVTVTNHTAFRLAAVRPNRNMAPSSFWELMIPRAIVWGNAIAEVARTNGGRPLSVEDGGGLTPLPPHSTRPWFDENGRLWIKTRLEMPAGTMQERFIDPFDTFHIKNLTTDGFWGWGIAFVGKDRIANGLGLLTQHNRFMGQGMQPDWLFTWPEVLSDEQRDAYEAMLDQRNKGLDNVGRSLLMDEGVRAMQLGMTFEAAQFKELVELDVVMAAALTGVPAPMLNALLGLAFRNREEAALDYINRTLRRWLNKICEELSWKLLSPREQLTDNFEYNMAPLLKGKLRERYAAYSQAIASEWLNSNEVREMEGFNPREGGDEFQNPNTRGQPTGTDSNPGREDVARLLAREIDRIVRREDHEIEKACRREKDIVSWLDRFYHEKLIPELSKVCPIGANEYGEARYGYLLNLTGKITSPTQLGEIVELQKVTIGDRVAGLLNSEITG